MTPYKYIVFCDFDGTVTNWESAEGLWELLLGNDFHIKMEQLIAQNSTTSRGIKELFGMVKSVEYPKILEYIKTLELRPGFCEFLDLLQKYDIPFVIVSGGIREMVEYVLKPYMHKITDYYCCDLNIEKEFIQISSEYDDGIDLLRKEIPMSFYNYDKAIYIGDSYTDMNPATHSDIVFAKDRLEEFLIKNNLSYHKFDTFYDVIDVFKDKKFSNL